MAKAECSRLDIVSISRRTKARVARVYKERRVALVDVCGEELSGIEVDSLRGNWVFFDDCFVRVLVTVDIEGKVRLTGRFSRETLWVPNLEPILM